jgi:muconolactone D-isomerase
VEFLVRSENRLPADTPPERREELRAGERARAMELRAAGGY